MCLLLEREEGKEEERERNIKKHVIASCVPPHWGPGLQSRHGPDWQLNWQPFGSQATTQPTEPYQPKPELKCFRIKGIFNGFRDG